MNIRPALGFSFISLAVITFSLFPAQASRGQKGEPTRLETASRRSQNAAKTIKVITGFSEDEAIPIELLKRAVAIGVFPDVVKTNLLFSQGMKGYGVICSLQADGWSMPAFYAFGSTDINLKVASFKSFDLVILFMNKDTVSWFQKGRLRLRDEKAGVAGPVGRLTHAADNEIRGTNIIMYALVDGKLKGLAVEGDGFLTDAILNPDNNINQAVYGIKGSEVLFSKPSNQSTLKPGVTAFRDILSEKFPVSK